MSKETPETKLCKYCKSEIPYDAKVCPHCRKKQTPNGCLIAIIVIVVLFILIGVAGGSSSSSNQNASSSASASSDASSGSSTPSTPTVTHAPSVYSIGDTAESNGVKVTLVNAETGHGSQYLTHSAGNIFVTLEFEIENDSSSDINVSSIASFEAYCDDYSVAESITAVTLSDKSTLDGNVAAGKKMNGVISYEVPKDWQNLEVTFSPSFWSNHSVTFEVKSN